MFPVRRVARTGDRMPGKRPYRSRRREVTGQIGFGGEARPEYSKSRTKRIVSSTAPAAADAGFRGAIYNEHYSSSTVLKKFVVTVMAGSTLHVSHVTPWSLVGA